LKTLLIDNYDSFTYNLFQLLAEANGVEPIVVRNDAADWAELERLEFDNVVVSPGPGSPDHEGDFGVCAEAIRESKVPLLGVCLGHQALGAVYGGVVSRAPELLHGKTSQVEHEGAGVLAGLPSPFTATRYHSLAVEADTVPAELEVTAHTATGIVMGLRHRTLPLEGVQFHPESVLTQGGHRLLANWLSECGDPAAVERSTGLAPLIRA
jgi:para-aminobenzoate synthetase component 2